MTPSINFSTKTLFGLSMICGTLLFSLAAKADLVGDFDARAGVTTNGGGTEVIAWTDQTGTHTADFVASSTPRPIADGTPKKSEAVSFDVADMDAISDANGVFALNGAKSFTAVMLIKPDATGILAVGDFHAFEIAQAISAHNGPASNGWALGYDADEFFFSLRESTGEIATVKIGTDGKVGNTQNEWWIVVFSWTADADGSGTPRMTLSLFDHFGKRVSERIETDPNVVAETAALFNGARDATGVTFCEDNAAADTSNLNADFARIQFYDDAAMTAEDEDMLALSLMQEQFANVIQVTHGGDSGAGSLRQALLDSGSSLEADLIVFDTEMIGINTTLTSGELTYGANSSTENTRVFGGGIAGGKFVPFSQKHVIDGATNGRCLNIGSGKIELDNLYFFNGEISTTGAVGAGVRNAGTTRIVNCYFFSNAFSGGTYGHGGGLANSGHLWVEDSEFDFNKSGNGDPNQDFGRGGRGGAVYATAGFAIFKRCQFENNRSGFGATSSHPSGTPHGGEGGAIYVSAAVSLFDCEFTNNATGSGGNSTLQAGNGGSGGAIYASSNAPSLIVKECTFAYNSTRGPGTASGGGAAGFPGSGGAVHAATISIFENSTFFSNSVPSGGNGAAMRTTGAPTIRHCTFFGNRGDNAFSGTAEVRNSIFYGTTDLGSTPTIDYDGAIDFANTTVNLIGNYTGTTSFVSGSRLTADPLFGTLSDNGGPTQTIPLLPSSPAIDAGIAHFLNPELDQRGFARTIGVASDLGAVEMFPRIISENETISESRIDVEFQIDIGAVATEDVLISVKTEGITATDNVDFEAKTEIIRILEGETTASFKVRILDDSIAEPNETFRVTITPITAGVEIGIGQVIGTISDDGDAPDQLTNEPLDVAPWLTHTADVFGISKTFSGLLLSQGSDSNFFGALVSFKLRADGTFSAVIDWKGERVKFSGQFDQNGDFTGIPKLKDGTELFVNLTVGEAGSAQNLKVTGDIEDTSNGDTADVHGYTNFFNGNTEIAPQAGRYTMLMPVNSSQRGDEAIPQGDGYAAVTVGKNGKLKAAGKLGDGTKFSRSSNLSANGDWAFWNTLYRSKPRRGYIAGRVKFRPISNVSDFDGELEWKKFADTKEKRYATGFTTENHAVGSFYIQPSTDTRALNTLAAAENNARLTFSEGKIPSGDAGYVVTWNEKNRITHSGVHRISTKLNVKTGLISGSYRFGSTKFTFGGAVFQKQQSASGYYLFGTSTGYVEILPGTGFDFPGDMPVGSATLLTTNTLEELDAGSQVNFDGGYAGRYYGTIFDGGGPETKGHVSSFSVRDDGTFTTVFYETGEKYVVKGLFDLNGDFTGVASTKSGRQLNVSFHTNEADTGGFQRIEGTLGTGAILLTKSDFHKKNNPSPLAGRYTLVIPELGHVSFPKGAGYATVSVSTSGVVVVKGLLGDRTKFSAKTWHSAENWSEFYTNLYRTKPERGHVAGKLNFVDNGLIEGSLDWKKLIDARETFFASGFLQTDIELIGAKFTRPAKGERALGNLVNAPYNARLTLDDDVFQFEKILTWDSRNRISHYGTARVRTKVSTKSGIVSGSYFEGVNRSRFSGVILQLPWADDIVKGSHQLTGQAPNALTIERW